MYTVYSTSHVKRAQSRAYLLAGEDYYCPGVIFRIWNVMEFPFWINNSLSVTQMERY